MTLKRQRKQGTAAAAVPSAQRKSNAVRALVFSSNQASLHKSGQAIIDDQASDDASVGCRTQKNVTSILAGELSEKRRGIVKNCEKAHETT
jgi:hypothetical protein